MSYYHRQFIFWALMIILTILHVDLWSWHRLYPILWGWLPFEMWYRALLTLLCTALFWLLARWLWPEPNEKDLQTNDEEGRPGCDD